MYMYTLHMYAAHIQLTSWLSLHNIIHTVPIPPMKDFFTVLFIPVISDILRVLDSALKLLPDFWWYTSQL